jgi:hypothetical protein
MTKPGLAIALPAQRPGEILRGEQEQHHKYQEWHVEYWGAHR